MNSYHKFSAVDRDKKDYKNIFISDYFFYYIKDSLEWIEGRNNGVKKKRNQNAYGNTMIEGKEIVKLQHIAEGWIKIFEHAPEKFYLTGEFSEEDGRYEKNAVDKEVLIKELRGLIQLCQIARKKKFNIWYCGIEIVRKQMVYTNDNKQTVQSYVRINKTC